MTSWDENIGVLNDTPALKSEPRTAANVIRPSNVSRKNLTGNRKCTSSEKRQGYGMPPIINASEQYAIKRERQAR